MGKQYRQGDVWIEEVDEIPASAVEQEAGPVTLAYGEVTGHSHTIHEGATAFKDGELLFFRVVGAKVAVEHQEHRPIPLPPGNYKVIRQREYTPSAIRPVFD